MRKKETFSVRREGVGSFKISNLEKRTLEDNLISLPSGTPLMVREGRVSEKEKRIK